MQLPERSESCQVRAHVIACTVDLPARSMVQNLTLFNEFHGCSFCEQPGETASTSLGGHVHVYPFDVSSPDGPLRKQETLMKHAKKALELDKAVSFCWSFCFLHTLKSVYNHMQCGLFNLHRCMG